MKPFRNILFPTDFSEHATAMAPYVRDIAQRFGARITVLHAFHAVRDHTLAPRPQAPHETHHAPVPYTPAFQKLRDGRQQCLEEFARERFAGMHASAVMEDGEPAAVIEWVAQRENTDLIMMPTKGLGKFRRLLLGSVAAKVLHDVACPVLTSAHEPDRASSAANGYHSLVCAVELNPEADEVLKASCLLAQTFGSRLCLLHIVEKSSGLHHAQPSAESQRQVLEQALKTDCGALGVQTKVRVVDATIARGIRNTALEERADLLVVGRGHERGGLSRVWSDLYTIISDSPCPVLSV